MVDRAMRIAQGRRRVTALIFPNDLQEAPYAEPARAHGTVHSGVGYSAPSMVPRQQDLQRAAEVLNSGKKVAILVGAGALHATDEVMAVAQKLGAGVAKALLGKAVLPDELPWVTGSIGLLGTKPSWDMMTHCDTLLMIGSGFPYSEFLPKEGQARGVQIDIEPEMLSLRYPMEVSLTGDSAETLRALLPLLDEKQDRSWRARIERDVAEWWKLLEARGQSGESAARRLGALAASAGARHHHERFRLLRQLVRARPEDPPRHDVLALRRSRLYGRCRALRDRGEVRAS
jgi:pyruvate dehydrogenase (quinone)